MFVREAVAFAVAFAVLPASCGQNTSSTDPMNKDVADGGPTGAIVDCIGAGPLPGALYDIGKSRFAFGSAPAREDSGTLTRFVGSHGVVCISPCGSATGIMNADAPETGLPDWSADTVTLTDHTRDYFAAMGVEACQVASADVPSALGGGGAAQKTGSLTRAVDGILVAESYAFARFNVNDQTTSEGLYWPALPEETVAAARAFRDQLADPAALAAYKAKLPASAQGPGHVLIHHTPGTGTCSAQIDALATFDVLQDNPMGMAATLSFDSAGKQVSTAE